MKEFLERFDSIPDMLELDHLTVSGDVTFGKGVSLKVCVHVQSIEARIGGVYVAIYIAICYSHMYVYIRPYRGL